MWTLPLPTGAYLTVFSVESLKGLKVFQKDPIGQRSILQIKVNKVWQRPRCLYMGR